MLKRERSLVVPLASGEYMSSHTQFDELAIHARTHKPLARQALNHIAELAFFILKKRRQQNNFGPGRIAKNLIDDLLRRLSMDWLTGRGIVRLTNGGEQNAQVIKDFGSGRDYRARTRAGTALLNRNRGGETLDELHIRLLHLIEELPGVSREGLHVLALPLSVDSVESKRRLPRTAQTGDYDQFIARDAQREIFQIVLTRTANPYELFAHYTRI